MKCWFYFSKHKQTFWLAEKSIYSYLKRVWINKTERKYLAAVGVWMVYIRTGYQGCYRLNWDTGNLHIPPLSLPYQSILNCVRSFKKEYADLAVREVPWLLYDNVNFYSWQGGCHPSRPLEATTGTQDNRVSSPSFIILITTSQKLRRLRLQLINSGCFLNPLTVTEQ